METDEAMRVLPFQLQFDKPVASQVFFSIYLYFAFCFVLFLEIKNKKKEEPFTFCYLFIYVLFSNYIDQNSGMESREGFVSHGYWRLENFVTPIQLAKIMDYFTW